MKAAIALAVVVVADIFIAAAVFAHFEHLGYWDACYYSETTALTVGYGDIVPHTGPGRLVASFLMWTTIPSIAVVFSRITAVHVNGIWHRRNREALDAAVSAQRIAADLYKAHTGEDHPEAPCT